MEAQKSIIKWMGRLAPKTARDHGRSMRRFMGWLRTQGGPLAEMSPDQLITYQIDAAGRDRFDILDLVQAYVSTLKLRMNSKRREYSSIRSFFMHNRAELPRDSSFKIRSETPPVLGTLTVDEIRDVVMSSKPRYQSVILSMFQGGMGLAEFDYWNLNGWESLREALRKNPDVIRIDMPGRKSSLNKRLFHTMIGGDAIRAIQAYLPMRPTEEEAEAMFRAAEEERKVQAEEEGRDYKPRAFSYAIFYTNRGTPITTAALDSYWFRNLIRLGIVKRRPKDKRHTGTRYGKNLHELRDVFRSQWEKSPVKGSVADFMMGHQVDPLLYNKAHRDGAWVRREYRKALPWLEIMSSGRPFGLVEEEEIDLLRKRVSQLETMVTSLTPGEESRRLSLLVSGRRMGRITHYQRAIESREDLGKLFDSETGKLLPGYPEVVRL
ncbi:unnamed protein product [marine sediment metagenome]|uniref:Core-binding (CB) domain-containing protein n=1 Tax=marine sediment metagenome TaxID=412755 RepID=X1KML3_9ZZZZ